MTAAALGGRLLIVNADDYGLTTGVSRGILRAHREGIVTSTSVLAVAPAFRSTVGWLRDTADIGVGAHLAAVGEDPPLLSAREIPTLVDRDGNLPATWRSFLPRVAAGRVDPDDLRRELRAQVECLRTAGLQLHHVDTHQHVHLFPTVRDVVLDVAAESGIPAVRVTRSARIASPVGWTVRRFSAQLAARAQTRGMRFPGAAVGLDAAGSMDARRIRLAVARLAATGAPTAELSTHPGEADDPERARYRWGYLWSEELAALTCPEVAATVQAAGFRLGSYADLRPALSPAAVSGTPVADETGQAGEIGPVAALG